MSDYKVFAGGDGAYHEVCTASRLLADFSGNPGDLPGAAHMRRGEYHIPFSFSGANGEWKTFIANETPEGKIEVGDKLFTHIVPEKTHNRRIVFTNCNAAEGVTATVRMFGVAGDVPLVDYDTAPLVELAAVNVDLSVVGTTNVETGVFIQKLGYMEIEFTAVNAENNVSDACFILWYAADHFHRGCQCECEELPCISEFPEPECTTLR